nr:cell division cycle protein 123 homolog [Ipomoea batatas]
MMPFPIESINLKMKRTVKLLEDLKMKGKFESKSYTFDIYVTMDHRIKLLDFNPWGAFTLPLLFTWEEWEDGGNELDFRIVENQCGVRPGLKTAVPRDYLDTSPGSGWDEFLRKANGELHLYGSWGVYFTDGLWFWVGGLYKQAAFCYEELIFSHPMVPLYDIAYANVSDLFASFMSLLQI